MDKGTIKEKDELRVKYDTLLDEWLTINGWKESFRLRNKVSKLEREYRERERGGGEKERERNRRGDKNKEKLCIDWKKLVYAGERELEAIR